MESSVNRGGELPLLVAKANAIVALKDGLVGRGILLDIPRQREVPWLEPGDHVFREDLEAAERGQDVAVHDGDILLVRVTCERARRWEFLFVAVPLRIIGGTGSPLNPVAVF